MSDYHAMQARLDRAAAKKTPGAEALKELFSLCTKPGVRIRQDSKPLMNGLESEWFAILSEQFPNYPRPRAQAKRYKLANGA